MSGCLGVTVMAALLTNRISILLPVYMDTQRDYAERLRAKPLAQPRAISTFSHGCANQPAQVAMTLRSDYHIVLGHKLNGPTQVPVDSYVYASGSDGH